MSSAPRVTLQDLKDNIVDTEILKHTTKSGQILRWAILTTKSGFAVVGKPSCAVSVENDNAEIGQQIAIDNSTEELWPLMGYALKETMSIKPQETPPSPPIITATLKIYEHTKLEIGSRLAGVIYNDSRGKFKDGEFVTTSPVADVEENKMVTVSGTVYSIERIDHDTWVAIQSGN